MGKGYDKFEKEAMEVVGEVAKRNPAKLDYVMKTVDKLMGHVKQVCDEEYDGKLAQDGKTFLKAWKHMYEKAREFAVQQVAVIDDDIAYGWFDEYVGLEEKAEEKPKRKQEVKKEEPAEDEEENEAEDVEETEDAEESKAEEPERKEDDEAEQKRKKELHEQLSFFGLL
jgi:hypothetical protein